MMSRSVSSRLRSVGDHPALGYLARLGYAVNGLLHGLIGVLAITVATGGGQSADQSGALTALSGTPGGAILLWVTVVGLAGLGVWEIVEALLARGSDARHRWQNRLKEGGKALAYLAIAATALGYARGGGEKSSSQQTRDFTASALASPGGIALLVAIGALVVGIGIYFLRKGARKKFLSDINRPTGEIGRASELLGMVGYIAKGVALVVVGVLFGVAALTADPNQATGLDGALKALVGLPFGVFLLSAVGVGFLAYGLYCVVRAVRARL